MKKSMITNKSTSIVAYFDGHGGALEQYRWHYLMRRVQGYPGSHLMLPSGKYLLRIALAAARATANKMRMKH
jgi:hypothetical protein